jgi:outer membrane murein-binding lipoprotein Lpp
MSLQKKYAKILSGILPAGLVGASLLLGSTAPSAANEHPSNSQPLASDGNAVAHRLAAIREAVSAAADPTGRKANSGDGRPQLAWGNWWNNWGWGRPWGGWGWPNWNNWRNWNNWNNWWRNW